LLMLHQLSGAGKGPKIFSFLTLDGNAHTDTHIHTHNHPSERN
jgi:hypothetical protein